MRVGIITWHYFDNVGSNLQAYALQQVVTNMGHDVKIINYRPKHLNEKSINLYCIDLICHGVGSPGVFEKSMEEAEKSFGKKIKSYTFRDKKQGWIPTNRYTSRYIFEGGTEKRISYDDYNRLFISQSCLRSSCSGNCRFQNKNRQGDFTIADFNEKMLAFPELKDSRGYSTLVFNNEKAKRLKKF